MVPVLLTPKRYVLVLLLTMPWLATPFAYDAPVVESGAWSPAFTAMVQKPGGYGFTGE